jgi:hypothetical protein
LRTRFLPRLLLPRWLVVLTMIISATVVLFDAASNSFFYKVRGKVCAQTMKRLGSSIDEDEERTLWMCAHPQNGVYRAIWGEAGLGAVLASLGIRQVFRRRSKTSTQADDG